MPTLNNIRPKTTDTLWYGRAIFNSATTLLAHCIRKARDCGRPLANHERALHACINAARRHYARKGY